VAALGLVALVPALAGVRRGLPVPGFRLSELLIVAFAGLIVLVARRSASARWGAFDWLALAYVALTAGLGLFDVLLRDQPLDADSLGRLVGPLQFFLLYRAVRLTLTTAARRRLALALLVAASIPVSVLALLQQLDVAGVRGLVVVLTGTDIYSTTTVPSEFVRGLEAPRATGPFPHWHNLGGYLFVIVLLCVALLLDRRRIVGRRLTALALVPAGIALFQTLSFAPIAGAMLGSVLIGLWLRRAAIVFSVLAVAAAAFVVVFGPMISHRIEQQVAAPAATESGLPTSIAYRLEVWDQFVPIIGRTLVTGYGPHDPPGLFFPYAESQYVTLLLRGGLPLLACFAALFVALAMLAARARRHPDDAAQCVVGCVVLATVVVLTLIHLIQPYFTDSGVPHLLWVLAGLLAPAAALASAPPAPSARAATRSQGVAWRASA
jgi:O-antigen ligase